MTTRLQHAGFGARVVRTTSRSSPAPLRRGSATRRVVAIPQLNREAEAIPSIAENYARRKRERAEAHARTVAAMRELDAAIAVGDRSYRRLRRRLDDYGTRLEAVRSTLRHEGYLDPLTSALAVSRAAP